MRDELSRARSARLRAALERSQLDAFVAASPERVFYASGYRSVAGSLSRHHHMAALVTGDGLSLVAPAVDAAPALEAGLPPDSFYSYGRFYFESSAGDAVSRMSDRHASFADALVEAVKSLPKTSARIGIDELNLLPSARDALAGAFPETELIDASAWSATVQAVKLGEEIERLRTAARLAENGIGDALAAAEPGITENELATVVAGTMVRGGGDPRFVVVTAGARSALADAPTTNNACKPGDLIRFDVGCVYDGYWSDMARTAVVGEPDHTQARRYDALLAGQEEQLSETRPGITAEHLFRVAIQAVKAKGLDGYRRHHCGHGIGTTVYETPLVAAGETTELQPGMTLCLETPYYEVGWGGMMVEDIVAVTESGCERLTRSDRSLRLVAQ